MVIDAIMVSRVRSHGDSGLNYDDEGMLLVSHHHLFLSPYHTVHRIPAPHTILIRIHENLNCATSHRTASHRIAPPLHRTASHRHCTAPHCTAPHRTELAKTFHLPQRPMPTLLSMHAPDIARRHAYGIWRECQERHRGGIRGVLQYQSCGFRLRHRDPRTNLVPQR